MTGVVRRMGLVWTDGAVCLADDPSAGTHDGVAVLLPLPPDAAAQLAVDGGLPASDLHITVCYCKDVDVDALAEAVAPIAAAWPPLSGTIAGLGAFEPSEASDGQVPVYAVPQVDGLHALHAQVQAACAALGATPSEHTEYVPHCTLTYLAPGDPEPAPPPPVTVTFTTLVVSQGEEQVQYPLGGTVQSLARDRNKCGQYSETDATCPTDGGEKSAKAAKGEKADTDYTTAKHADSEARGSVASRAHTVVFDKSQTKYQRALEFGEETADLFEASREDGLEDAGVDFYQPPAKWNETTREFLRWTQDAPPLTEPVVVWRGVAGFLGQNKAALAARGPAKVGDVIPATTPTWTAFSPSTATDYAGDEDDGVMWRVTTKGPGFGIQAANDEFVLSPGTFTVTKVERGLFDTSSGKKSLTVVHVTHAPAPKKKNLSLTYRDKLIALARERNKCGQYSEDDSSCPLPGGQDVARLKAAPTTKYNPTAVQQAVRKSGRATVEAGGDREVMHVLGPDGRLLADSTGGKSSVGIGGEALAAMKRRGSNLTVVHNHPGDEGQSLSDVDLQSTADFAGIREMVAVTEDGSVYRGKALVKTLKPAWQRIYKAVRRAGHQDDDLKPALHYFAEHVVNQALADRGALTYTYKFGEDTASSAQMFRAEIKALRAVADQVAGELTLQADPETPASDDDVAWIAIDPPPMFAEADEWTAFVAEMEAAGVPEALWRPYTLEEDEPLSFRDRLIQLARERNKCGQYSDTDATCPTEGKAEERSDPAVVKKLTGSTAKFAADEIQQQLGVDADVSVTGTADGDWKRVTIDVVGKEKDEFGNPMPRVLATVTQHPNGQKRMRIGVIALPPGQQSKGTGSAVIRTLFDTAMAVGAPNVDLHAAMEVGPYVWARLGFDQRTGPDDRALRESLMGNIKLQRRYGHIGWDEGSPVLSEKEQRAVIQELKRDPRRGLAPDLATRIADLRVDGENTGKKVMLQGGFSTSFVGTLDLRDKKKQARLEKLLNWEPPDEDDD